MIDIEIATYWNVETLHHVFNGVAAIMGGAGFGGLLKVVFLFALMLGIFAYAGNKQLELAKWFVQALIFTTLLNMPIARVAISDRTDLEPPRVVDNVPFTLAVVAQTANLVFGWVTRTYEAVFGVPESLGLQQGDLAFGHRILKNVNKVVIRDPGLRADLMQFIKECTLYDIKDGVITPAQVVGQTDTWNTIFNSTSPARYATYNTLTPAPTTDTCVAVAVVLKARVDGGVDAAQAFYGRQNFSRADTDATASAMFGAAIGTSYDWLLASSATASDAMKQAMFNNIWREAGSELPALMGDTARIQELQTMAGAAQAARQSDGSNATLSLLAQETLPHMRNWLEAIIYSVFPLVVVLMVVVSAEGAKKVIGGYMMSLAWVGMWPVMFAVINHLSLIHLRNKVAGLKLASGVPFQLSDVFDATLANEQAAIGYLVVLVPFLSGALIKLGQGGFMSVADKMVAGFSSAASAVGSSLSSGNVNMGQAGIDTASVNTTSMHKYDGNIGLSGGGASIGYGSGSTGTMAPNGSMALQQFQSRMLSQMVVQGRMQSDRSQESHETSISSSGQQVSVRHGDAATLTDVKAKEASAGSHQQTGTTAQTTTAGGESGTYTRNQGLSRQLSDQSQFSASAGAHDSAQMGLNVGRGASFVGAGGGAVQGGAAGPADSARGVPTRATAATAADEKRIVEAMRKGGATQGEVDSALRNIRGGATEPIYRTITDDFGDQVQVPIGQQRPASSQQSAAPPSQQQGVAPRQRGGLSLGASLGFQSQKTYQAQHGRDRSVRDAHSLEEGAGTQVTYSTSGQQVASSSASRQSVQNDRHAMDASRTSVDERTLVRDVSDRRELGAGNRVSRSTTDSVSVSQDLLADPTLMQKVASRNGMTAARFIGQEEGRIMEMVRDYAAEKGVVTSASSMPQATIGGAALRGGASDLKSRSDAEVSLLPNDIAARHKRNTAKTGYQTTARLEPDTSVPLNVDVAGAKVGAQLDPNRAGSIPKRAGALDENVEAWASPDKKLGEGRANPLAVVEGMEGRDIKDSALKLWDKVTGGDGTADGEKLNDNKRRETQTNLVIKRP